MVYYLKRIIIILFQHFIIYLTCILFAFKEDVGL